MNKLLILEDDDMLREILRESFRERGYIVQDYPGLKAYAPAEDFVPTHAIIDLKLQGESGLDALASLKDIYPYCRMIILTGYGSIATAVQAMKLGAINYICKPATLDEIEFAFRDSVAPDLDAVERPRLHEHEREYIEKVLQDVAGNVSRAARVLGIHRQSLQRKLRKYT
jgi:two-component system response regulator RegA